MAGLNNPGPKRGYKQTHEHIRKRFAHGSPNWKGEGACVKAGRTRALRMFVDIPSFAQQAKNRRRV